MSMGAANEQAKPDAKKAYEMAGIIDSLPDETKLKLYWIIEGLRLAEDVKKQPA